MSRTTYPATLKSSCVSESNAKQWLWSKHRRPSPQKERVRLLPVVTGPPVSPVSTPHTFVFARLDEVATTVPILLR